MKHITLALLAVLAFAPVAAYADHHGDMPMSHETVSSSDDGFIAAHEKMMENMHKLKPTGNADNDFAAQMIPHHQAAIDMAKVELEHGKDPVLRKMAEDIIKAQEEEIKTLQEWQSKQPK
jgi:uncharacterized protein (DUF305 family)